MNKQKTQRRLAHGAVRWQAARLKPVVKKAGITNIKKQPKKR